MRTERAKKPLSQELQALLATAQARARANCAMVAPWLMGKRPADDPSKMPADETSCPKKKKKKKKVKSVRRDRSKENQASPTPTPNRDDNPSSLRENQVVVAACREEPGPSSKPSAQKRKHSSLPSAPLKKPKSSAADKGKSIVTASDETPSIAGEMGVAEPVVETPAEIPLKPMPKEHQNFGFGERFLDAEGKLLLQWDPTTNRVTVSTLLLSWRERDTIIGDAFALSYGLYDREDPDTKY
ncbi:hypothetical protein KSP39_PZI020436 [Platanthera zijinensis]|uniref:Uncharacterized protein n=1 Tax=Platanthera zijinensis TaxID=2320716 RepID=A0AAP0B0T8_9ASPA